MKRNFLKAISNLILWENFLKTIEIIHVLEYRDKRLWVKIISYEITCVINRNNHDFYKIWKFMTYSAIFLNFQQKNSLCKKISFILYRNHVFYIIIFTFHISLKWFCDKERSRMLRKISCEFIFHKIDSHGWHLANSFELNWGIQTQMPACRFLPQSSHVIET